MAGVISLEAAFSEEKGLLFPVTLSLLPLLYSAYFPDEFREVLDTTNHFVIQSPPYPVLPYPSPLIPSLLPLSPKVTSASHPELLFPVTPSEARGLSVRMEMFFSTIHNINIDRIYKVNKIVFCEGDGFT
jgi:hypothetical protein